MFRIIRAASALAASVVLSVGIAGAASATAVQLDQPIGPVTGHAKRVVDVDRAHRGGRVVWVVTFRDGSRYRFTACRQEDGRDCYWDARHQGNGAGSSFVDLAGRVHYTRNL